MRGLLTKQGVAITVLACSLLASPAAIAQVSKSVASEERRLQDARVRFEENRGQHSDARVSYVGIGGGYRFSFYDDRVSIGRGDTSPVVMTWSGTPSRPKGEELLVTKVNYLKGNDPERWLRGLPTYAKLGYRDIRPGIDLIFHGGPGTLEYDVLVSAGASLEGVAFAYPDASRVVLAGDGSLTIENDGAELSFRKPVAFQTIAGEKTLVDCAYRIGADRGVRFELGAFDPTLPLVIDPVLDYSTYYGGGAVEYPQEIAVDAAGAMYVGGVTESTNFPGVSGGFQGTWGGGSRDGFVLKLNADGTLAWATYLGGNAEDEIRTLALHADGSVTVAGETHSPNFPTTPGAFDTVFNGSEAFVAKLAANGATLIYSTLLGGTTTSDDVIYALVLDSQERPVVTGECYSGSPSTPSNFPTTAGAYRTTPGYQDTFITKFSADGSTLVASTLFGGPTSSDWGYDIVLDSSDQPIMVGVTSCTATGSNTDYPLTADASDNSCNAGDVFIAKMNASLTTLIYSSYFGGSASESNPRIAMVSDNDVYIGFTTTTDNLPVQDDSWSKVRSGSSSTTDAYLARFSPLPNLVASTYFGGDLYDSLNTLAVDSCGVAWFAGGTGSRALPVTPTALQTVRSNFADGFLVRTDTRLLYESTLLGGDGDDGFKSIAVRGDTVYAMGTTTSADFPTTSGALYTAPLGGGDLFVTRITADHPAAGGPDVYAFTATALLDRIVVEWVNPKICPYVSTMIRYSSTAFPASISDGTLLVSTGAAGTFGRDRYEHTGLTPGETYYYTAFVETTAGAYTTGKQISAKLDLPAEVSWKFSTQGSSLVQPALWRNVYVSGNDRMLHAMGKGASDGQWPVGWKPLLMTAPSQTRPSVVDLNVNPVRGATRVAFVSSTDGRVYAVDGTTGARLWGSPNQIAPILAPPSLAIREWGISLTSDDLVLTNGWLYAYYAGLCAYRVSDGTLAWWTWATEVMGTLSGQPTIDYATRRVYVTSRKYNSTYPNTLWAFTFTNSGYTKLWAVDIGSSDSSPMLVNGVLYVGNNAGTVYAINPSNGSTIWTLPTADGPIKAFVFPDRNSNRIYFSTTNFVWCVQDVAGSPRTGVVAWSFPATGPSSAVFTGNYLYFGSGDGYLYRLTNLTAASPTSSAVSLGAGVGAVGTPTVDVSTESLFVGTESGSVFRVKFP